MRVINDNLSCTLVPVAQLALPMEDIHNYGLM